ncbi:MAG: hypothetical protein ACREEE_18635 [Dongiaceae bacterium]
MRKIVLGLLLMLPATALAQPPTCGPRADLVARLGDKYQEAPIAIGLGADGNLVEILTAADGATWSILITAPEGRSCLVAAGEAWQQIERVALEGPPV